MAVEIVEHRQDGGATVVHREAGHGGVVLGVNVRFLVNPDGTTNADFITLPCPVCGATSVHPVGGGSAPFQNQMEFGRLYTIRAQELGIPPENRGWPDIVALVCSRVEAMDGPGRCMIAHTTGPDDTTPPGQGPT
jgi:hypothetical protein